MNRHVQHRAALLGLALIAMLALALGIATGAQAAFPGANGTLAFTSTQDGGARHIFTGTTAITDLTGASSAAVDTQPEFSPDGRALVFTGSGQGLPNSEIFVMSASGAGRTQLTKTPQGNGDPAWSPDGTQIAFVSERANQVAQIFVMRSDGTAVRQLTHDATGKAELAWSPKGDRIVFVGTPAGGGDRDIWSIRPDGSGLTDLTNDSAAYDVDPAFSPDGARIVYSGPLHPGRESVGGDLWVMNADGTNPQPLHHESNGYSDGGFPAWSPDGSAIAFAANDGSGYFHIWSVPAAGGENTELVANKLAGRQPGRPGRRLAAAARRRGAQGEGRQGEGRPPPRPRAHHLRGDRPRDGVPLHAAGRRPHAALGLSLAGRLQAPQARPLRVLGQALRARRVLQGVREAAVLGLVVSPDRVGGRPPMARGVSSGGLWRKPSDPTIRGGRSMAITEHVTTLPGAGRARQPGRAQAALRQLHRRRTGSPPTRGVQRRI